MDRLNKIRELGRCTKCLRSGHGSNNCERPKVCVYCEGFHPKALCKKFLENVKSRSPSPIKAQEKQANTVQQATLQSSLNNHMIANETLYLCTENRIINPKQPGLFTMSLQFWDQGAGLSMIRKGMQQELQLPIIRTEAIDVLRMGDREPMTE